MTPDGLITSEFDDPAVMDAAEDAFDRFRRDDHDTDGLDSAYSATAWPFARLRSLRRSLSRRGAR
jgi:hypothetical protein